MPTTGSKRAIATSRLGKQDGIARAWELAFYGAFGAVAPDIVLLYTKRWSMPSLTFSLTQYVTVTGLYLLLAAIVATAFPYGKQPTRWKAFVLGVCLPVVISGLASLHKGIVVAPRGSQLAGSLWDLLALF